MDSQANASSFNSLLAGQVLSRIAVGVILTDPDGRIQWVNDRQQWFTGVPPQGLLGHSIFEHPGLYTEELHEAIQYTLVKGKIRQLILRQPRLNCRIEVSPLTIEGRLLGAAVCFYEAAPQGGEGDPAGDDPLNQLVADEQRAMVRMLSSLLDGMPFAVAAVTFDGAMLYVNAAWRSNFSADALDLPLTAMLPEKVRAEVEMALKLCWKDGRGRLISGSRNGDGAAHYWIAPLPANQELTLGLVVALRDLPAAGEGDQNLFAQQMTNLCQFTARIVHDIRNPLTALMCELELLRNDNLYEPGGVHKFQSAIDLFTHQVEEINGILEEIEPMGADDPGHIDAFAVSELVKNARFVAEWHRPYKGVHVELEMPEDLPPLTCDGLRLQKALAGLLFNALDQAGAAGRVALQVDRLRAGVLDIKVAYSTARPGVNEPLPPQPPWRSANLRLALAYSVITELGGGFEMRRLHGGETEITIQLSGLEESPSLQAASQPS
jgi:signal transduction histidine kinase